MGYAVFYYNEELNTLDLFFGFSHIFAVADGASGHTSAMWVSHPDASSWPKAREGRPPTSVANMVSVVANEARAKLPVDYTFLYKTRQDVGCPDSFLPALESQSHHILDMIENMDIRIMFYFTAAASCGVEYLRPDDGANNAGYDIFAALGLMHFMSELPPSIVAKSLARHIDWNEYHDRDP